MNNNKIAVIISILTWVPMRCNETRFCQIAINNNIHRIDFSSNSLSSIFTFSHDDAVFLSVYLFYYVMSVGNLISVNTLVS